MRYLLLGAALVYAALAGWAVLEQHRVWGTPWTSRESFASVALSALVVPLVCVWAAGEAARAVRRPRLLTGRAGRVRKFLLGVAVATVSTVPMGAGMIWATDRAADALITGCASALVAFGLVAVLPRWRRGVCRGCGYDLSSLPGPGQPGFGLCPECGSPVMAPA